MTIYLHKWTEKYIYWHKLTYYTIVEVDQYEEMDIDR